MISLKRQFSGVQAASGFVSSCESQETGLEGDFMLH
ncbi:hypothetical protein PoMZ_08657 [Pyricularia oryzae]|uniref:Uncharacterized protein n=2 Tax=Pyricularia oryzae TaxID=318829 RepID=A0A4P7NI65_PYROR|nr:hypothetical protein PoMZ_08657 [Pyricularia oryzae]